MRRARRGLCHPLRVLGEFLRFLFERAAAIGFAVLKRKKITILGIGHEQKPEEHRNCHTVGEIELLRRRFLERPCCGHPVRKQPHDLIVDPVAKASCQTGCETPAVIEQLLDRTAGDQRVGRKDERQEGHMLFSQQ